MKKKNYIVNAPFKKTIPYGLTSIIQVGASSTKFRKFRIFTTVSYRKYNITGEQHKANIIPKNITSHENNIKHPFVFH